MKASDLNDIPKEDLQELLARIYTSHVNDVEFYKNTKYPESYYDVIKNIHQERVNRIDHRLTIIRKNNALETT